MAGVRGQAALGRLVAAGSAEPDGDAALLARFAATADEAAFNTLVRRHGPLVRAACRRHLRQPADVDDAVQATFLVLTRKAGSVHTAVGPFLYRVAERTAWRLRRASRRTEPLPDVPGREGLPADVRTVVADELGRLPERYRVVVELCYVTGVSTAEAATRLGWPKGTVLTRLAWARKRLRANLTRRGVTLGGSLAAVLLDRSAMSRVKAGEESNRVLSLCEGVVRAMALTKLGWAAGLTVVAVTGVVVGPWAVGQQPTSKPLPTAARGNPPVKPVDQPLPGLTLPSLPSEPPPPSGLAPPQLVPDQTAMLPPILNPVGKTYTVSHPAGSYVREFADGERFAVRFADDRLYVEATFGEKGKPTSLSLEADYAINKEGVVFGVITAAEYDGAESSVMQGRVQLRLVPSALIGEPFAFRVRMDDGTVTVKDARLGGVGGAGTADSTDEGRMALAMCLNAVAGRYTASKEPVASTRKPGKPKLPKLEQLPMTQPVNRDPVPTMPSAGQPRSLPQADIPPLMPPTTR